MTGSSFARSRPLGEVEAEPFECLVLVFGVLACDPMAAADIPQRHEERFPLDVNEPRNLPSEREQQMLGRKVLVTEILTRRVGGFEGLAQRLAHLRIRAVGLRQLGNHSLGFVARRHDVDADAMKERQDDALLLPEKDKEKVFGNDLRMRCRAHGVRGPRERFGRLDRPTIRVERHGWKTSLPTSLRMKT